jgi:excisionase family DNA binding protein
MRVHGLRRWTDANNAEIPCIREAFMQEKLLTIDEVATQLRVTSRSVQTYMAERRIRFARMGRVVRFRQQWVDEFLDRSWDGPATNSNDPSFS